MPSHTLRAVPSAAIQIYERLREGILRLEYVPGQPVSESDLASRFGVSRTPVREAVIRLAGAGLLEVRPQRGTFVTRISPIEVIEARFLREAIEVAVVERISGRTHEALLKPCVDALAAQSAAATAENGIAFHKADDAFHQALADTTGFSRAWPMIESEKALMDRVRLMSLIDSVPMSQLIDEHVNILEAVRAGDRTVAAAAMRTHLRGLLVSLPAACRHFPEYFSEPVDEAYVHRLITNEPAS